MVPFASSCADPTAEMRLGEYLDGELDAAEEPALFGHLSTCAWCRRQFEARGQQVVIDLSDVALLRYGGEDDELWKASFVQHYRSSSLDSRVRKDQLWRRTPQGFEIVFEDISES